MTEDGIGVPLRRREDRRSLTGRGARTMMAKAMRRCSPSRRHARRVEQSRREIVHGDSACNPFGLGTYGSRSAAVGGAAIAKAVGKIIDKGRKRHRPQQARPRRRQTRRSATFVGAKFSPDSLARKREPRAKGRIGRLWAPAFAGRRNNTM
jgi:CO/xanthine dehydrogenase Mo-binding subunit